MNTQLLYDAQKVFAADHVSAPTTFNRLTSAIRILPSVFIAGVQKGGTTSLYSAIMRHPQALPAKEKEVFFFGNTITHAKGINWYRQYYATRLYKKHYDKKFNVDAISFDASTNTFDSVEAPARIKQAIPHAKVIILLRDPVKRAVSHYEMSKRLGFEQADFDTAIALEEERIRTAIDNPLYTQGHNFVFQRLGYKSRGIYINYIKNWYNVFDAHNILVLNSEFLFESPHLALQKVFEFLQFDPKSNIKLEKLNVHNHSHQPGNHTIHQLNEFYKSYNHELFDFLNHRYNW